MTARSPWVARFDPLLEREEIRRRATIKGHRLAGLDRMPLETACSALQKALEEMFVVGERTLDLLELHVGRALAHSVHAYPDVGVFVERTYAEEIILDAPPPLCVTGLAGVGKSQIAAAVMRVMPPDGTVHADPTLKEPYPLRAARRITVQARSTLAAALTPLLPPDAVAKQRRRSKNKEPSQPKISIDRMVDLARGWSYKCGLASLLGDEIQFLTPSALASTQLSRLLLTWTYVSVPSSFLLNFSACHKLMRRPQEERDRLLSLPVVVMPDLPDSKDWLMLLEEYQTVCDDILDFRLTDHAEELYSMTVSIKRALKRLTVSAYRRTRHSKRLKMSMENFRAAFRSRELLPLHEDVMAILAQQHGRKPDKKRRDLWSPFGDETNFPDAANAAAARIRDAKAAQAHAEDSLSAAELKALRELQKAAVSLSHAEKEKKSKKTGNVTQLPKRNGLTGDALLRNSRLHRERSKR